MKKFLKVIGIILVLFIIAIIALPIIFKGKIENQVKILANENLNAKVDFSGVDLSLISNFPNVSIDIDDFMIEGLDTFAGVKLVDVKSLESTVEFWSLFGDQIAIKKITLDQPKIDIRVLENGEANYDIAKDTNDQPEVEETASADSGINIKLQDYEIVDAFFSYSDKTMPVQVNLANLNHRGSGDLTADHTLLETLTTIDQIDLDYDGVKYIKKANFDWKAILDLDLKNSKYTFKENVLQLNDLIMAVDGWIAMPEDDIDMDITYKTTETSFKQLLSMIPAEFATDLNGVDVTGKMNFAGFVKGTYNDNLMPGFGVDLAVNDGRFQYPDMPKAVENIQIKSKVNTQGGANFNDLWVDVSKCYMEIAENPIDIKLNLKHAMTDPLIDCSVRAKMVLDNLKDVIPLEQGDALEGLLLANLTMKGQLSDLEKEDYDKFHADGDMQVQDILYKTDSLPYDVNILVANLDFSPAYLDLTQFKGTIGKSDIQAVGKATNYLAYALKDEKIKGNFTLTSQLFDLNEMMVEDEATTTATTNTETPNDNLGAIDIPGNIDFKLNASINKMLYGDMVFEKVSGNLIIDDHVAMMDGLTMNFLEGKLTMDGKYDSNDLDNPQFDLDFDMKDMNINQSAEMFYTIDKMAPIAKSCEGKFSTQLKLKSALDQNMEPVISTMDGTGRMDVKEVYISKFKPLNELASTLGIDRLAKQTIKDVKLSYMIQDGKAIVKPFKVKIDGMETEIAGSTGLIDQTIDYTMTMDMPYSKLPKQATGAMNNLMDQINSKLGSNISMSQKIPINIKITGTVTQPKIRTNYGDIVKDEVANIKETVKEEINQKVDQAKEEARRKARQEADKILADAKKKSDKLLADARRLADQGKNEAYAQAAKVEKSYKNVLEKAAKKLAADKIRQQADQAHTAAMNKARQQSDALLNQAQKQADAKINAIK